MSYHVAKYEKKSKLNLNNKNRHGMAFIYPNEFHLPKMGFKACECTLFDSNDCIFFY